MSAHKSRLRTSDFFLLLYFAIGIVLEFIFPTDLLTNEKTSIIFGVLLFLIAIDILIFSKVEFRKHQQKTGPGHEISELVTSGPFKYSRNPIYVAVVLILAALAFISSSFWVLLSVVPLIISINYFLIIPEERYLSEKFSDKYKEYKDKTRKWI